MILIYKMSSTCLVLKQFLQRFYRIKSVIDRIYNFSALIHFVNQTMLVLSGNVLTLLFMAQIFTKASIGLRITSPNGKDTFHQTNLLTNVLNKDISTFDILDYHARSQKRGLSSFAMQLLRLGLEALTDI